MTETLSLNQLAKESGRSKTELKKLHQEGILIGEQDNTGNHRFRFIRASAVAAGILPNRVATTHPRHDGTIDTAVRAAISDELQPVVALLSEQRPDVEHTALTAALDRVDTTLQRIETMLRERLPARRKRRWWL